MVTLPKDRTDLQLAPVVLALDRRLDEFELFDLRGLEQRVRLDNGEPATGHAARRAAVLGSLTAGLDMHGWTATWNGRGLRIVHQHHHVTLGIPATFTAYIDGRSAD
jgi:hypothetical protein